MKSLSTQVKHAKITSREVFIHLRKNGGLKRKSYAAYLKMQYHVAGCVYQKLQSTENHLACNAKKTNSNSTLLESNMPVNLYKSELSAMSQTFDDTSYLTEAWHFFLKEKMKNTRVKLVTKPIPEMAGISNSPLANQVITIEEPRLNIESTANHSRGRYLQQETPQTEIKLIAASGFDKLNQNIDNSGKAVSLCSQILNWAKEGKLILN